MKKNFETICLKFYDLLELFSLFFLYLFSYFFLDPSPIPYFSPLFDLYLSIIGISLFIALKTKANPFTNLFSKLLCLYGLILINISTILSTFFVILIIIYLYTIRLQFSLYSIQSIKNNLKQIEFVDLKLTNENIYKILYFYGLVFITTVFSILKNN